MTTNDNDPRLLFSTAAGIAATVIAGTDPAQHRLATSCDGFDVGGLLGHLLFVVQRVAAAGRGENAFDGDPSVVTVASNDWVADWDAARAAVARAWSDDSTLDSTVVLPWATMTGAETLEMWTSEVTTHTWDLARATGQQPVWDDDICAASLNSIRRDLPTADRTAMWASFVESMPAGMPFTPPFGNAVPIGDDAPLIEQLVAWTGRNP